MSQHWEGLMQVSSGTKDISRGPEDKVRMCQLQPAFIHMVPYLWLPSRSEGAPDSLEL